ncbi:MAG: hypothetical protein RLZZ373_797 [Pseudomonadota bacterium]|jgi:hypothetical protein
MASKRILCEQRLRHIPAQFSWIDQRLVFEGHLARCDAPAAALYLFLLTVADAQGLSYWGDARVMRMLSITHARLARAREDLLHLGLIAYERPLYQVLALDGAVPSSEAPSSPSSPPPSASASASAAPVASSAPPGADHDAIRAQLAQVRERLVKSR